MSVDVQSSPGAAQRIADTLLRVMGGAVAQLRMAQQPAPGDAGQVGLPGGAYQDTDLGPAVFRRMWPALQADKPNAYELLLSASSVDGLMEQFGAASAQLLFAGATGVVVDGTLRLVTAVGTAEAFGSAYLYRVMLRDV